MGIYIKNMELPNCCHDCPLFHIIGDKGYHLYCAPLDKIIKQGMDINVSKERLKDCPLVEIRRPHGKLVDMNNVMSPLFSNPLSTVFPEQALHSVPVVLDSED